MVQGPILVDININSIRNGYISKQLCQCEVPTYISFWDVLWNGILEK